MKKILLLCSGGDAPGMNAAIRAATRCALHEGLEVFACEMGYQGLIEQNIFPLHEDFVANSIQRGGTILKTGRCEAFQDQKIRAQCNDFLNAQNIDGLIVLGGNGSFAGAALLADENGPAIVGIPCTIDNDIQGTEYTIGFDTARNTALEAIDRIRDTAFSHGRNFMIEVMGRSSGFLAVDVGISGGAEIILIPEFPLSTEKLVEKLKNKRREKLTSIIVAAEAGQPGHALALAKKIKEMSGIEYRVCILGHTQRGGAPTVMDRKTSSMMGAKAVEALLKGKNKKMVALKNNIITLVKFSDPKSATRFFEDKELLKVNEIICEI